MTSLNIAIVKQLQLNPMSYIRTNQMTTTVLVHPIFAKQIKEGVKVQLDSMLNKYIKVLGGMLVAYEAVKVYGNRALLIDPSPFLHIIINATFYVFSPNIGDIIEGTVVKKSPNHVGCLVHGMFNISCFLSSSVKREHWAGTTLQEGDSIKMKITEINTKYVVPHMKGNIDDSANGDGCSSIKEEDSGISSAADKSCSEEGKQGRKKKKKKVGDDACERQKERNIKSYAVESSRGHISQKKRLKRNKDLGTLKVVIKQEPVTSEEDVCSKKKIKDYENSESSLKKKRRIKQEN